MALTSEEVVENGTQVIEQVNQLAERMVFFQQRLDILNDVFNDLSEHMDDKENTVRDSIQSLEAVLQNDALSTVQECQDIISSNILSNTTDGFNNNYEEFSNKFNEHLENHQSTISDWENWSDDQLANLLSGLADTNTNMQTELNRFIEQTNSNNESIDLSAQSFIADSDNNREELLNFVNESISSIQSSQENYNQAVNESFVNELNNEALNFQEFISDLQTQGTTDLFEDLNSMYQEFIDSTVKPLVNKLLNEVKEEIDEMIQQIINIGEDADDKNESIDVVTEVLESLMKPINEIIDRTQGIKDTVGAFL